MDEAPKKRGRPLGPEGKAISTHVKLHPPTVEAIKRHAAQLGVSQARVIEMAVEAFRPG